ncbi:Rpn family recombination-promoting nuclease/putative transposase [Paenibacillus sp. MMS20-IR301]|uniref:Rpn family recombination-promoting nuclease/putative transposase n=1 Tax=Paenibacillus sp. MMS20-IR301 TaxID=2895946 RepID=UPI0028E21E8F|nr:Rpn family recombination-promoting nuclease/putative transposase [Paenibacillus sp. MMS20-IR301]WNS43835.1 Rpn family recombination-promoting nuclease/putative transposase [Paenibacillus sp. MMS20-IR301]
MELLDPRVDFVFKRIFASENNKDVLLAFLNVILLDAGAEPLDEVVLLNPYTDKDDPLDKQSIFDIWAKTASGKLINIEMQLFNQYDMEKRTLYYWSKRYSSQLQIGGRYVELKKCITINILNYNVLPNAHTHSVFHLREDSSGVPLIDDIEIHFLELPKLKKAAVPGEEGLINWLLFLKGIDTESWEVLRMNEPELQKAMETLEYLSQNPEARRKYEDRQKFLHDEASQRDGAQREGFAKGLEQGLKEGLKEGSKEAKLDIAKNLLQMGIELQTILASTGLTEEEIKSIN